MISWCITCIDLTWSWPTQGCERVSEWLPRWNGGQAQTEVATFSSFCTILVCLHQYYQSISFAINGDQHVVGITDQYWKLTGTVYKDKVSAAYMSTKNSWPLENFVLHNDISVVQQWTKVCEQTIHSTMLGPSGKESHNSGLITKRIVEWESYSRFLVSLIPHHVAEQQMYCKIYVKPLIYAYNKHIHSATCSSLLNVNLPERSPSAATSTNQLLRQVS